MNLGTNLVKYFIYPPKKNINLFFTFFCSVSEKIVNLCD